jgi:hypothetical protein
VTEQETQQSDHQDDQCYPPQDVDREAEALSTMARRTPMTTNIAPMLTSDASKIAARPRLNIPHSRGPGSRPAPTQE